MVSRFWLGLTLVTVLVLGSVLGCGPAAPTAAPTAAPKAAAPTAAPAAPAAPTAAPAAPGAPAAPTVTAAPAKPTAPPAPKVTRGGTLRTAALINPTTLDPQDPRGQTNCWDEEFYRQIYDGVLDLSPKMEAKPGLAEKTEFPDKTTMVLTLRKGVKFHDGTDWNADSFLAWLADAMVTSSGSAIELASIDTGKKVDDYTVRLSLKAPQASLVLAFASRRSGFVTSPAGRKKYGKEFGMNPVGSGPFKFVKWTQDSDVSLERFEQYWGKDADGQPLPYLDKLVMQIQPQSTVQSANFQAGTLDLFHRVPPETVDLLKANKEFAVLEVPLLAAHEHRLNGGRPPFNNRNLRRAMAFAMDREAMVKVLYQGQAKAAIGQLSPASWAFDPNNKGYPLDLQKAKEELALGGQPNGFSFDVFVRQDEFYQRWGQVYQEQLAKVGINVKLDLSERSLQNKLRNEGNWTSELGQNPGAADPDLHFYSDWHCKSPPQNNYYRYCNPKMDELLDAARSSYDVAERKRLYSQINQLGIDDSIKVWVAYQILYDAVWTKVQGYQPYPDYILRLKEVWIKK